MNLLHRIDRRAAALNKRAIEHASLRFISSKHSQFKFSMHPWLGRLEIHAVTRPAVLMRRAHDVSSNWIEMDIPKKLEEVTVDIDQ